MFGEILEDPLAEHVFERRLSGPDAMHQLAPGAPVLIRAKHQNVGQHGGGCVASKAFGNRCQFEVAVPSSANTPYARKGSKDAVESVRMHLHDLSELRGRSRAVRKQTAMPSLAATKRAWESQYPVAMSIRMDRRRGRGRRGLFLIAHIRPPLQRLIILTELYRARNA